MKVEGDKVRKEVSEGERKGEQSCKGQGAVEWGIITSCLKGIRFGEGDGRDI